MKITMIHIKRAAMLFVAGFLCVWMFRCVFFADAAGMTGTVKNRILNVRKEASTSSSIVCKLSKGTKVTIVSETTGTDGMKWYSITFSSSNGTSKGYVRADLVSVSGNSSNQTPTSSADNNTANADVLYVKNASVRVRDEPSTSSAIVAGLVKDNAVDVRGTKTGTDGKQWTKVSFTKDGQRIHGYIRSDLLTSKKPANVTDISSENKNQTTAEAQNGDTLYVSASAVRVREEPSASSTIVANLLKGDEVRQKSVKTGDDGKQWTKVSFSINGTRYRGYIRSDYLTKSNTSKDTSGSSASGEDSDTRYVTASAVRVRDDASDSCDIVANLLKGDKVSFRSVKTGGDGKEWTKVSFTISGTKYHGYIRSDYLSKSKPSDDSSSGNTLGSTNTNNNTDASGKTGTTRLAVINVRQSATTSSGIVAKVKQGTKATILSETTGTDGRTWYYISCVHNGSTIKGYVRSDLLNL